MNASPADASVSLSLESRPESVALVRAMLAGAAEELGFGAELLADLKTAVSEACNNVVVHAYPGEESGPMRVTVEDRVDTATVIVDDRGVGMEQALGPGAGSAEGLGIGLAVIDALAARWETSPVPGGGSEIRMEFAHTRTALPELKKGLSSASMPKPEESPQMAGAGEVLLEVGPPELLAGILGRVAGAVAAEANFSIDRYADLYLVTDGIAAHARDHAGARTMVAVMRAADQRIDLSVSPFAAGSLADFQPSGRQAAAMLLTRLVDELRAEPEDSYERLRVVLTDRPHVGAASG